MSLLVTNIVTAVKEVIDGTIGSVRTITAGDFQANRYYQGQPDEGKAVTALVKKSFDVVPVGHERTSATLPENHSISIQRIFLKVLIAYRLDEQCVAARRDAVRALAGADAEDIRQALSYPGNLTQTNASAATGLISGLLVQDGPMRIQREDWEENLLETEHSYTGLVKVTMPVS